MTTTSDLFDIDWNDRTMTLRLSGGVSGFLEDRLLQETQALVAKLDALNIDNVVIDFSVLPVFGSTVLEAIVQLWNVIEKRGGRLIVAGLSKVGAEIIALARFDTIWPVCTDVAAAHELLAES